MSILIVDDYRNSRLMLEAMLNAGGFSDEVLTAASAHEALKHLGVEDPGGNVTGVDLILMDITMPEVDGIEACRQIKGMPHLRDIPIIMVTALNEAHNLESAFDAGAADYITKPVNQVELRARVRSALTLKREMDARKLAYIELEQESLVKTQILSTVSHELKTPLTGIFAYVELLTKIAPVDERQPRYLERIQRNARRLKILIDDLLDVSRIEAGALELSFEDLRILPEIEEVVHSLQNLINEKRTNVVLNIPSAECRVTADRLRFSQVITNLLSNACKYSPAEATVTITAKERAGLIQIDVSDTGIGISKVDQAQLFTKFFRVDNSSTQEVSGTGLGLFITNHLVEAQGGKIWVASKEGKGSTFSFTLPHDG